MPDVDGKVCLVTGAADGIGKAIARKFAERGAAGVVVADLDTERGEAVVAELRDEGRSALFVPVDMRSKDSIAAMIEATVAEYGSLDVLVNNAGIIDNAIQPGATVDTLDEDTWDAVYDVNVKGVWLAMKYAVPHLRRSTRGPNIINAASTSAFVGSPGAAAYCSSKGAVLQLTRAAAVDLSPHIRCNCYAPSATRTRMMEERLASAPDKEAMRRIMWGAHLVERPGQPEEIANVVCFLASDDASFVTGAAYMADGGSLAWRGSR